MPPRQKTTLRTVGPDEAAPEPEKPVAPKTLAQAIESGSYLEILLAQRRQIATDLPTSNGPAKAALHRQLSLLSKEIEELKLKALEDGEGAEDDDDADEAYNPAEAL